MRTYCFVISNVSWRRFSRLPRLVTSERIWRGLTLGGWFLSGLRGHKATQRKVCVCVCVCCDIIFVLMKAAFARPDWVQLQVLSTGLSDERYK
jgi:hypothetical protein